MLRWYLKIRDRQEGPYTLLELKKDYRVTPVSLVRRVGEPDWVRAADDPELASIFDEERPPIYPQKEEGGEEAAPEGDVLAMEYHPPNYLLWLVLLALLLLVLMNFYL